VPLKQAEEVLRSYREKCADLNVRQFQEKLQEAHDIELSYTRVKLAQQGAGLVKKESSDTASRRQGEENRDSLLGLRLDPDAASVPFHNLLSDGQADSAAWIPGRRMQTLRDFENSRGVLRIDPDAIVFYGENPFRRSSLRRSPHSNLDCDAGGPPKE